MKKLIIAAAIVCAAVISQAATFNWKASGVKDITGATDYTGNATLFAMVGGSAEEVATIEMSSGSINTTVNALASMEEGVTYSFYYTMEDAKGNLFTSGTKTGKVSSSSTPKLLFSSSGSWTEAPEPTSGLLLLLGVAGLALKRKQK